MSPFQDRVAVITGGASGLGRALSEALAERGARVVLADVDEDGMAAVVASIVAAGGAARAVVCDVADADDVAALVDGVVAREGRLDLLFNNAGIAIAGEGHELELADWQRTLDVDLDGVVHGIHAAYPVMIEQGAGQIVNVASLAGLVPTPLLAPYAAAKHAVVGLSNSLRAEAAASGVRVSVVCPGLVATPLLERAEIKNEARFGISRHELLALFPFRPLPIQHAVTIILRGVARNRPLILVGAQARLLWWLHRLSPTLVETLWRRAIRRAFSSFPFQVPPFSQNE